MLVTLLGASCSGKDTIARHLTTHESFTRVHLRSKTDSIFESAANSSDSGATNSLIFDTPADFLDHATLDWRNHFVTSARLSKSDLQNFRKRPWVLLVNVEAPLSWRYARSIARFLPLGRRTLEKLV